MYKSEIIIYNGKSASGESVSIARLVKEHLPHAVLLSFYDVLKDPSLIPNIQEQRIIGVGGDATHGTLTHLAAQVGSTYLAVNNGSVGLFPDALGLSKKEKSYDEYIQRLLALNTVLEFKPGEAYVGQEHYWVLSMLGKGLIDELLKSIEVERENTAEKWPRLTKVMRSFLTGTLRTAQPILYRKNGVDRIASDVTVVRRQLATMSMLPIFKAFPDENVVIALPPPEKDIVAVYSSLLKVMIDYILLYKGMKPRAGGLVIEPTQEPITIFAPPGTLDIDTHVISLPNFEEVLVNPYAYDAKYLRLLADLANRPGAGLRQAA